MQSVQSHPVIPHCVAGPGWSNKATRQVSFVPAHTADDAKCHYFKKGTHLKNCLLCFGSQMPLVAASNFTRGAGRGLALMGGSHWSHPSPATGWQSRPSAAKPSIAYPHVQHTPPLVLPSHPEAEKRLFLPFYFYSWGVGVGWGGRSGRGHWTQREAEGGWSNSKGSYWGKGVQGLTVVVLPSVTSTTGQKKRKKR